jgi:hypothetical protein
MKVKLIKIQLLNLINNLIDIATKLKIKKLSLNIFLNISFFLLLSCSHSSESNTFQKGLNHDALNTAKQLLTSLKESSNTDSLVTELKLLTESEIESQLKTDEAKISFWVNIYNAYILIKLKDNAKLYEDRRSFFKLKCIPVGGQLLSFADVEHGILRHSKNEYSLGYLTNPFAPKYEKRWRVKNVDYRIHFALNCGAASCPPISILPKDCNGVLDQIATTYLKAHTKVLDKEKKLTTTVLAYWFKHDFGGKKGLRKILLSKGIINSNALSYDIDYSEYDWTLKLFNFAE